MFEVRLQTCYNTPMQRPQFITKEIYHVYNRGVEKRTVFLNTDNYRRFIRGLEEFNDSVPATNLHRPCLKSDFKQGKPLVEILCYCLMPNHYHLLLRQLKEGGITGFMRKIGTGYTNYFNLKNNRVGPLFQGKFKVVHLKKEAHFLYLPHYIHLNPLDLKMPGWRERKIQNAKGALRFLESYRWSSYPDYIGKKNFPSVITPTFISGDDRAEFSKKYRQEIKEWLEGFESELVRDIAID